MVGYLELQIVSLYIPDLYISELADLSLVRIVKGATILLSNHDKIVMASIFAQFLSGVYLLVKSYM